MAYCRHYVPKHATADTGDHAHEDQQKDAMRGRLGKGGLNADDGEDPQTDGIHQQHGDVIGALMPFQKPLNGGEKDNGGGNQRRGGVDGVTKSGGGRDAQCKIPDNAARPQR